MAQSHDTDTNTTDAQWSPSHGDLGEETIQAIRDRGESVGKRSRQSDAYEIRMTFGIPAFDADAFDYEIYPDRLIHEKPAERTSSAGGTDWLKVGERGWGKSTDTLHWACRLMEENGERVVWRGSPSRSEWLPFRHWATVWLPSGADVSARWVFDDEGSRSLEPGELGDVVRRVRRYDDVLELVHALDSAPRGSFHVVYPDPSFAGCEALTRRTSRTSEALPFVSAWTDAEDATPTPITHWWFAFLLARVEFADSSWWTSLMYDELGELVPSNAEQDEHRTYSKVLLFRSCMIDSRRERLSLFASVHRESQTAWQVLEEFSTRIHMPDGSPNPQKRKSSTHPYGFSSVPMYADVMSSRKIGTALMFSESEFTLYRWSDLKGAADERRTLKLEFGAPGELEDDVGGAAIAAEGVVE